MDVGKVDSATLEKCRKDGIKFDLELDMVAPQIILDKTKKIKIKEEMEKSESCEYWKEKSHFLNQFELSNVDENQLPKLHNLLWAFRHIFYNESTPAQFRTGLTNIPPIHIARVPGLVPRHEKLRQVPDSKLAHLKKHIANLVEMGVLVPATDVSGQYASPVHIVVEKRFIASKNKVEEKSRLTIDARAINETLAKSAYPLPLCDQFRRDIAKRNYKVFSNLDMKEMYHQIKCDQETSRKCFGVHALGRIWLSTRLLMGCKQAPSIAQSIVDQAFDHHENTKPFEDDFTVASTDEETHGQTDLPVAFATASYYNMLMCPRKCIFFAKEARILGHLIGEEKITLSAEKIEKIKSLPFPSTKKKLVSDLAFFQWFNRLCPRLSEFSAPLRHLARDGMRFTPTEVHREAYEKVKDHLLDEELNVLRMPSSDPRDLVVCFTDASSTHLSCVLT